jgi:hypothetical protein
MVCHCFLCGCSIKSSAYQLQYVQDLQDFVRVHCKATPFHYNSVMQLPQYLPTPAATVTADDGKEAIRAQQSICLPCISFQRNSQRGRRSRINFTPFDHILLFCIEPGSVPAPDARCFTRLLYTLRQPNHMFLTLVPYQMRLFIDSMPPPPRALHSHLSHVSEYVRVWWEAHGSTHFFRHASTAQLVRRIVRKAALVTPTYLFSDELSDELAYEDAINATP